MDFKDIVMKRYAVKKFTGESLPQEKVDALLELIRYAPSSFNIQPWRIKVVTDKELLKKLQDVSFNQEQISTASHLLVFCADKDLDSLLDKLHKQMIDAGILEEKIKGYFEMMRGFISQMNDEQKLAWSQKQTYIALGNALNGATALGFDSCPMEGFDPKAYKEILDIPEHLDAAVLCPIGIAADEPKPKLRFPKEDILL